MRFINFMFSIAEKLGSFSGARPTGITYDVKETLVVVARTLDSTDCRVFLVQNDARSEALAIKVVEWHQWGSERYGQPRPIVICIYQASKWHEVPSMHARPRHENPS